jgi:hypothetical protein
MFSNPRIETPGHERIPSQAANHSLSIANRLVLQPLASPYLHPSLLYAKFGERKACDAQI